MSTDNQSAQSALLPCPFCGKSCAKPVWASDLTEEWDTGSGDQAAIVCDASQPNGPGGCGAFSGFQMDVPAAITVWNLRAALAQAPAQSGEAPDMPAICAALGFDPTNHHNAAKCPYCRPATPPTPEQAGPSGEAQVPDGVWEALQRMIEDGLLRGAASRDDALAVARYRDRVRFLASPGAMEGAQAAQPVLWIDPRDFELAKKDGHADECTIYGHAPRDEGDIALYAHPPTGEPT